jgi:hypothetical protein
MSSILKWKANMLSEDDHPELSTFLTYQISRWLSDQLRTLTHDLWQAHEDTILILVDDETKKRLLHRRMEGAREARQAKQAQRAEMLKKRGERLAAFHVQPPPPLSPDQEPIPVTFLDSVVPDSHIGYDAAPATSAEFLRELNELASIPEHDTVNRNYTNFPMVLDFAFLLSSTSRAALRLARRFMPLPCPNTVYAYYKDHLKAAESSLTNIENLDDQITTFIKMNKLPEHAPVSVAVDAMAMSPDRSYLPAKDADYSFVIYGQPLDRKYRCLPLHVITARSGNATAEVRKIVDDVCERLSNRGLIVKYLCTDGDAGYNEYHRQFFAEWYPRFLDGGLPAVIAYISQHTKLPLGDFLHLWKLFCNRVKNHSVTLSPESLANFALSAESLETLLKLGDTLRDRSSIGKMRDSYPLRLFSLENCLKCLKANQSNELMYLLPWALQEEVLRNPALSRDQRLEKAVLGFQLLMHYYDLSCLPHVGGVTKRFSSGTTQVLAFADDCGWLRVLNTAVLLIEFITNGDENWSFSRLGTHCLENFFGLVRQSSRGDDRFTRAIRVIRQATVMVDVMDRRDLHPYVRGRDNVGGTIIGAGSATLSQGYVDLLCHSFIAYGSLHSEPPDPSVLIDHAGLIEILDGWCQNDNHHKNDPGRQADLGGSTTGHGIAARNHRRATPSKQRETI